MNSISNSMIDMVQSAPSRSQESTSSSDYRDMMKKMLNEDKKTQTSDSKPAADAPVQKDDSEEPVQETDQTWNGDPFAALVFMMAGTGVPDVLQTGPVLNGDGTVQQVQTAVLQADLQPVDGMQSELSDTAVLPLANQDGNAAETGKLFTEQFVSDTGNTAEVPVTEQSGLANAAASDTPVHAATDDSSGEKSSQVSGDITGEGIQTSQKNDKTGDVQAGENVHINPQPMAKTEPQNVTQTAPVTQNAAAESSEAAEKAMLNLPSDIADKLSAGKKEFTVQLEPESLGKLMIKASYEDGKATVSIICTNEKTLSVLSAHARELGAILENSLGTPTDVYLNQKEQNYLEQEQHGQNQQQNQQDAQEEEKKRHSKKSEGMDFLNQFRLGLV